LMLSLVINLINRRPMLMLSLVINLINRRAMLILTLVRTHLTPYIPPY
jgi:hypothetical protein